MLRISGESTLKTNDDQTWSGMCGHARQVCMCERSSISCERRSACHLIKAPSSHCTHVRMHVSAVSLVTEIASTSHKLVACARHYLAHLCVQTHFGDNARRLMQCDRSDLQLVRLLANASQRTPFPKTRLIGTQRKMPRVGLHQTHRCTYRNTSSGRWLPINASSARSFQHRIAAIRTCGSTTTHRLHPLFDRQHRTRMRSTLASSPHTKKRHRFRWRLQSRHDCCVAVVRCLTA